MVYFNDTPFNVTTLSRLLPHMSNNVAKAWLRAEGQAVANPTNPLNIRYYGTPNQIGEKNGFAVYKSAYYGLLDAARLIKTLTPYSGVRAALTGGNDHTIAKAIELSPWAAGHYGATQTQAGTIERLLGTTTGTAPVTIWAHYVVRPGDTLSGIAAKYHTTWQVIYSANRVVIGSNPNLIHPGQTLHIPTH
jgi:LysM repeat protein